MTKKWTSPPSNGLTYKRRYSKNLQSKSTHQHGAIEAARLIYEFRWRDETTRYKKLLLENDNLVEMAAHEWFEWWGTVIRGFRTLGIFPVEEKIFNILKFLCFIALKCDWNETVRINLLWLYNFSSLRSVKSFLIRF